MYAIGSTAVHIDNLRQAFGELDTTIWSASAYITNALDPLGSAALRRLADRRRLNALIPEAVEQFGLVRWALDQAAETVEKISVDLLDVLEPPRSNRTRYGRKTGIHPHTPIDWGKCGTPAQARQHQRRGQCCPRCNRAVRDRRKALTHAKFDAFVADIGKLIEFDVA
jgi:hypothetical protein